jgi:hypothetical protein
MPGPKLAVDYSQITANRTSARTMMRAMGKRRKVINILRKRIRGDWCIYCGDLATTDEHFPPITLTTVGLILPACRECNGLASTHFATDFEERCQFVKEKLRNKYSRVMQTPDWDTGEIKTLGYSIKTTVKKWQSLRDSLKPRLAWNHTSYLACIDQDDLLGQFEATWARERRGDAAS